MKKKKTKRRKGAKTDLGYCPNWVTIQWKLYRDTTVMGVQWVGEKVTIQLDCIVIGESSLGWGVILYRDMGGLMAGK